MQPQVEKQSVERMWEGSMSHTFDWTWQFEAIQVTSENVCTKLIRISQDLNDQIAPGKFTFLELDQEPGCRVEWLTLTVSPERQ